MRLSIHEKYTMHVVEGKHAQFMNEYKISKKNMAVNKLPGK